MCLSFPMAYTPSESKWSSLHSLVWKILHAVEQLSPRVAVTEPMAYVPQLLKPERLESCALRQEKGLQ